MKTPAIAAIVVVAALSTVVSAKGLTTRITISGGALRAPITIDDAKALRNFQVWAGPGVQVSGVEQQSGFIADWTAGAVHAPSANAARYTLAFYTEHEREPSYVVDYEFISPDRGLVYLPGKGDSRWARNVGSIVHGAGYEGFWFNATREWQRTIAPLLARR